MNIIGVLLGCGCQLKALSGSWVVGVFGWGSTPLCLASLSVTAPWGRSRGRSCWGKQACKGCVSSLVAQNLVFCPVCSWQAGTLSLKTHLVGKGPDTVDICQKHDYFASIQPIYSQIASYYADSRQPEPTCSIPNPVYLYIPRCTYN